MKIENLLIEGFKGLRYFELKDIPNFAVFIGPNGAGKSSVLEAIGLLKDWVASYTNSRSMGYHFVNAACDKAQIQADFRLSEKEASWLSKKGIGVEANGLLSACGRVGQPCG